MKYFLSDIIPRLKKFSATLDQSAFLVDKPWVVSNGSGSLDKLIFRRDGRVHLSSDGSVRDGTWEYLPEAQSLLIDYGDIKKLYRHQYLDQAVLALKQDGFSSDDAYFLLANENVIPDCDAKKYLQSLMYNKYNVITGLLENGKTLEVYRGDNTSRIRIGMDVTIDGDEPKDGIYRSLQTGRAYKIKNGMIFKIIHPVDYQTKDGLTITIEQSYGESIEVGDLVYIDNKPAKSGKYRLGIMNVITVKNGAVAKTSMI